MSRLQFGRSVVIRCKTETEKENKKKHKFMWLERYSNTMSIPYSASYPQPNQFFCPICSKGEWRRCIVLELKTEEGREGKNFLLIYRREMNAEKLEDWELEMWDEKLCSDLSQSNGVCSNAKRALIGAGARALFYPTLLYNVVRNKIQPEFHWWDRVDEFILLGAVPFAVDIPRLKKLGVGGVVTLNESYETLVPTLFYHAHSIDHLVIPTRDYLFAPSLADTCRAVDFIYSNASLGRTTYVHCKAGRGRSTTIVLCYLVEHKEMTPYAAYNYVKSIRPRIVLASAQWQAVQDYYLQKVKKSSSYCTNNRVSKSSFFPSKQYDVASDDDTIGMVTESDLNGYEVETPQHDRSLMAATAMA